MTTIKVGGREYRLVLPPTGLGLRAFKQQTGFYMQELGSKPPLEQQSRLGQVVYAAILNAYNGKKDSEWPDPWEFETQLMEAYDVDTLTAICDEAVTKRPLSQAQEGKADSASTQPPVSGSDGSPAKPNKRTRKKSSKPSATGANKNASGTSTSPGSPI